MKRILVDKNEGVAEVVEKILSEPDPSIVLVVPRGVSLGDSVSNFRLLKREAEAGGKRISVESVDEGILAFAKSSELPASHPLLDSESRAPLLSDIVAAPRETNEKSSLKTRKKMSKKAAPVREQTQIAKETYLERKIQEEARPQAVSQSESNEPEGSGLIRRRNFKKKFVISLAIAVMVLVVAILIVNRFFIRATVVINFNKTSWTYENNFVADTAVSRANFEKNILPGELFTLQKNLTQVFPASAVKQVSEKATGRLTIYNAYNSKPQTLVATTRFLSPDGKIFRLQGQVLVPGAEIKNGNITPAHIEADVLADQAGPAYNVGPVPKLTIPGFQGKPQYNGFYGELKEGAKGGFVGKKAVPTADDVQKAKGKTRDILTTSLETNFLNSYPPDFKILDGSKSLNVVRLNANESTDQSGNFSVFGEANLKVLGFRESDVRSVLVAQSSRDNPNTVFKELNLQYNDVRLDLKNNRLSFKLTSQGILAPAFSPDDFKNKILGQKIAEVRSLVSGLPGLASAKVSLWPIWLGSVPSDPRKVSVSAD